MLILIGLNIPSVYFYMASLHKDLIAQKIFAFNPTKNLKMSQSQNLEKTSNMSFQNRLFTSMASIKELANTTTSTYENVTSSNRHLDKCTYPGDLSKTIY